MKKIKRNGSSKIKKKNNIEAWPEEYEEQRSMNIRMKPQPFQSSSKQRKENQRVER